MIVSERVENPCNGYCQDRDSECHGKCEKYAAYRAWIDECNKRKRAAKDVYGISDTKLRMLRKQQRKNGRRNSGLV